MFIRPKRLSQSVLQRSTRSFRPRQIHSIQWRPVRSIRMNVGGTGYRDQSWQSDQLAIVTRVVYTSWLIQAFAMCILAVEVSGRTGLRERGSMSDRGLLGGEEQSVQIGGVACKDRRTRECATRPDGARAGDQQDENGRWVRKEYYGRIVGWGRCWDALVEGGVKPRGELSFRTWEIRDRCAFSSGGKFRVLGAFLPAAAAAGAQPSGSPPPAPYVV